MTASLKTNAAVIAKLARIEAFIGANPNCTATEIAIATGLLQRSLSQLLDKLRKANRLICTCTSSRGSRAAPTRYRIADGITPLAVVAQQLPIGRARKSRNLPTPPVVRDPWTALFFGAVP